MKALGPSRRSTWRDGIAQDKRFFRRTRSEAAERPRPLEDITSRYTHKANLQPSPSSRIWKLENAILHHSEPSEPSEERRQMPRAWMGRHVTVTAGARRPEGLARKVAYCRSLRPPFRSPLQAVVAAHRHLGIGAPSHRSSGPSQD